MLKEDRFARILAYLNENEFATVQELSEKLDVSMPTIRRDLTELSNRNQILRSHGGAMSIGQRENSVPPRDFRRSLHSREKSSIAKTAVGLITANSVVYLDASTSAAFLADHLDASQALIVITNSIPTAIHLSNRGIRTYCPGGQVLPDTFAVVGPIAMESVDNFNIDYMFFSSYGINDSGVIVDPNEGENEMRRHVLERCRKSIFLCDHSKFGKNSAFSLADLGEVDYVITDRPLPADCPAPRDSVILVK